MNEGNKYDIILTAYKSALNQAEEKIGFDANKVRILKGTIDEKVVNTSLEQMYNAGTDYTRRIMVGPDQAKKEILESYLQILDNKTPKYEKFYSSDITKLKDAKDLNGAHAGVILSKLFNTFNYGLKLTYVLLAAKEETSKK